MLPAPPGHCPTVRVLSSLKLRETDRITDPSCCFRSRSFTTILILPLTPVKENGVHPPYSRPGGKSRKLLYRVFLDWNSDSARLPIQGLSVDIFRIYLDNTIITAIRIPVPRAHRLYLLCSLSACGKRCVAPIYWIMKDRWHPDAA